MPIIHRRARVVHVRRGRGTAISAMLASASLVLTASCQTPPSGARSLSAAQRAAIADTVKQTMIAACNLSGGNVVARLMSLYPDTGQIISASVGHITTSRDSLRQNIQTFWTNVGRNMRDPKWEWTSMHVDVLAPDAAAMTATYSIPHLTPTGMRHVIGGAWTAVFQRRGKRWVIVQEHLSDLPQ
ncbi:MAG TPA: nuclear transport factor 2 family protein [Gemmatimonadaceae bacterium]|nr:nuclear transport factor 2 family protein [Gemmatimonadaceae bacterium]